MAEPAAENRQRIDKWLWHARVVRTRAAAASLAAGGYVRINGRRVDAPSRAVKAGDVVTVALDSAVKVLKVVGFAPRRGASTAAKVLYEDLNVPEAPTGRSEAVAARQAGTGRPTKRDRRALDRFRRFDGDENG